MAKLRSTDLLEFLLEADPRLDIVCDEHNNVCLVDEQGELIVPCAVANPVDRVQAGMDCIIHRLTYYLHCRQCRVACQDQETIWLYAGLRHFLGEKPFDQLERLVTDQFRPDSRIFSEPESDGETRLTG